MGRKAYINGLVYTADENKLKAASFIVEDGRFAYVGDATDLAGCDECTDLGGACVIPGLVDSHCHMISGVEQSAMDVEFVEQTTTPGELGDALLELKRKARRSDKDCMVAMGIDLTVGTFSAADIDRAVSDRPVVVFSFDGHALLLNSFAMKKLGIDENAEDPSEDSYYARDEKGVPTGLVIEIPAMRPCKKLFAKPTPEVCRGALGELSQAYSALGYTTVFDAMSLEDESPLIPEALDSLDRDGALNLRAVLSFGYSGAVGASEAVRSMEKIRSSFSSPNVIPDTLKMIGDGTIEEHSALLGEPYSDEKGGYGSLLMKPEDMAEAASLAAKAGFSVHIHAIGDKAVDNALEVLTSLGEIKGTKTIAHNQLYTDAAIKKISEAGDIFFQTTPQWMTADEHTLRCLGPQRFSRQFPVGTMVKRGVTVTFGSDCCLEEANSDAFLGMFYACARGNKEMCGEECLVPESESITRMESLFAYTANGARQLGLSDETGSIKEGLSADFVIVDRDIINCPLPELKDTEVIKTYFRGKTVYGGE